MTTPAPSAPLRRHARSNRARILAVARRELGSSPDTTLDEIAIAAGVARRTLYGHFPGREALLEALAEEAEQALRDALEDGPALDGRPEYALAQLVLRLWGVGDRYRMLISVARRDLGVERVEKLLEPARHAVTAVLARGQEEGTFHRLLPVDALNAGLEALSMALLERLDPEEFQDLPGAVAMQSLVAAGVPALAAQEVVGEVRREAPGAPPGA
ncbi:helix-turn-helix domain-containing protein [Streptacidiphilus sp. N1-10]|uniref:Helix-turn-helix domain-containing protein n=1 Tax=Streptacidiphilus jeojiensis TaxID=3229225 RepID=A0ABV6XL71_9ACTN